MTGVRPLTTADLGWAQALNQAHGEELSYLSPEAFSARVASARFAFVSEPRAGFLLAFDAPPVGDTTNFDWLKARAPNGVYVDRIVIDPKRRGEGRARTLYETLFETAAIRGADAITCEINVDPPNPASQAFHEAMGFRRIGEASLFGGRKTVAYLALDLRSEDA